MRISQRPWNSPNSTFYTKGSLIAWPIVLRAVMLAGFMLALIGHANAQAPTGNIPAHQATVSWTPGVGDTSTGFNVYKCPGTCTLSSGTFSSLTATPLAASVTSYVDKAVTANTPYSWCTTELVTINTGTFETVCSNIVSATIPKDYAAPTDSVSVQ